MERTALDSVLCVWCVHTAVLLTACACAGVCDVERSESKSACPCLPCRAFLVVSESEYRDVTCVVFTFRLFVLCFHTTSHPNAIMSSFWLDSENNNQLIFDTHSTSTHHHHHHHRVYITNMNTASKRVQGFTINYTCTPKC